jgi:hypothetical protein
LGRIALRLETLAGDLMVTVPAIAVEVLRNTSTAFIGVAAHTV